MRLSVQGNATLNGVDEGISLRLECYRNFQNMARCPRLRMSFSRLQVSHSSSCITLNSVKKTHLSSEGNEAYGITNSSVVMTVSGQVIRQWKFVKRLTGLLCSGFCSLLWIIF